MGSELQQIADLLSGINRKVDDLPANLKIAAKQIFTTGLSDINANIGRVTSGEFRTGNGKEPGYGFTGVRMAYPPMLYNSEYWDFVTVEDDKLQIGMKSSDGKLYAGNGSTVIDENGITSVGGTIGGWIIGVDTLTSGTTDIILDSANKKITINDSTFGNEGIQMDYNGGTPRFYVGNGLASYLKYDGTDLFINGSKITEILAGSEIGIQNWQATMVFSALDVDTASWTSGSILIMDGTSYSISAGNTGNMIAKTYIYLDVNVSTTVLQTTTGAGNAIGTGRILIAVAENGTNEARFQVFSGSGGIKINGLDIEAGTITADRITVSNLQALSANMGNLSVSGLLTMNGEGSALAIGITPPTSSTEGTGIWIDRTGIYGLLNSSQQMAMNSTTGKFDFCGGLAYIDADGITGSQLLKWMIRQIATSGANERTMKFGMDLPEGSTTPAAVWSYTSPAGAELMVNGGAELGDFTGWTKTTETNGVWNTSAYKRTGTYSFIFFATTGSTSATGVLTSARMGVTAANNHLCAGYLYSQSRAALPLKLPEYVLPTTAKIEVKWYDHISAGSLLRTDTIRSGAVSGSWVGNELAKTSPTGALSAAFVLTMVVTKTNVQVCSCYFDDMAFSEVTANQKLWLADNGLNVSNLVANYSPTLLTKGRNQNGGTTSSHTFMWQRFFLYRKIKLASVLCDCRNAATYTCTLRDFDDNVLATSAPVTIAAATANVVFDMGGYEMLPGRYRVRITRSSASTWWFTDALFQTTEYEVVGTATFDTTESSTGKAPFKLQFYNELP